MPRSAARPSAGNRPGYGCRLDGRAGSNGAKRSHRSSVTRSADTRQSRRHNTQLSSPTTDFAVKRSASLTVVAVARQRPADRNDQLGLGFFRRPGGAGWDRGAVRGQRGVAHLPCARPARRCTSMTSTRPVAAGGGRRMQETATLPDCLIPSAVHRSAPPGGVGYLQSAIAR